jgi:hypothetical protein
MREGFIDSTGEGMLSNDLIKWIEQNRTRHIA